MMLTVLQHKLLRTQMPKFQTYAQGLKIKREICDEAMKDMSHMAIITREFIHNHPETNPRKDD